jgi:hypothetical protein
MNVVVLMGARSLISHAAGSPVTSMAIPKTRKVHGMPNFWIRASMAKLMAVPPRPPPA